MNTELIFLRNEALQELENNILPFWMQQCIDTEHGGFRGRIRGDGSIDPDAPKGAILNARILWTFSAAFRVFGKKEYIETATRAKREIIDRFYDKEYGGVFWSLDSHGRPLDTKKQIYALGFAIYGLSEYARATGDKEAEDYALRLFNDIEKYSFDNVKNGYFEALTRDWQPIADMRLSEKDANEHKTMNTHLHIIEPYTNLYRVCGNERLRERIVNLLHIFTEKILDCGTGHLQLFFDDDWNSKYSVISFGHDIEASWLLHEAAEVTGENIDRILPDIVKIADAAGEGYIPGGGMLYEFNKGSGAVDADRHWWVQAEAVVGYLNIYGLTGDEKALTKAVDTYKFIKEHIVDKVSGEWFWSLKADGTANRDDDKAGFWKCPYHNSRMCLEIIERTSDK